MQKVSTQFKQKNNRPDNTNPTKVGGEIRVPKDYRKWSRSHSFTLPQFNILNMYSCETKSNEVLFWIISMSIHQFIRCSTDSSVFIIVWLTKYFRSNIISFKTKVCTTCSSSSSKFEFTHEKRFIPIQWKFYFELAHFGASILSF